MTMDSPEGGRQPAAFFVWLALAIAAFAAFTAWNPPVQWILLRLVPVLVAALWIAAAYGFGSLLRRDDPLIATAYGLGILAAAVLALGLVHLMTRGVFATVAVAGLACALVRGRDALAQRTEASWMWLVPIVAVALPLVAAPETSSDALFYHLLIPKLWLRANAIATLPLFVESHYPPLAELQYAAMLALHSDVAAKALHFLVALLAAAAIIRLGNRSLAAMLFLTMPVAALAAVWAWNDMFFTLFVLLAIVEIRNERFGSAGALFGLAAATKYTFVLAGVGLLAMLVMRRTRPRDLARFALPFVAISIVWMTKNAIETHNPIYPFVFASGEWTAAAAAKFHAMLSTDLGDWPLRTYFEWPLLMTMRPRDVDTHTGLLPLLLLPLAFLAPRTERRQLGAYVIATFAFWLVVKTVTRSLLASFALLFVLIALGYEVLPRNAKRVVAVAIALATVLNFGVFLVSAYADMDPVRYFVGLEQRDAYIARTAPRQRIYLQLNRDPRVRKVLLVALHDPFHLDKPALFSSRADTPYIAILVARYGTADRVAEALRADGVTHIVVDTKRYSLENVQHVFTWNDEARAQFRALLGNHARAVGKVEDAVIFELTSSPPPAR